MHRIGGAFRVSFGPFFGVFLAHTTSMLKDLAEYLNKHPAPVRGWVMRGVSRRAEDPETAARIDALDRGLCERSGAKS